MTEFSFLGELFTFMHLGDAFIQRTYSAFKLYIFFGQYMCSLGIEPTTFALLMQCSTTEPQGHQNYPFKSNLVS